MEFYEKISDFNLDKDMLIQMFIYIVIYIDHKKIAHFIKTLSR